MSFLHRSFLLPVVLAGGLGLRAHAVPPLLCQPYSSALVLTPASESSITRNTVSPRVPLWKLRYISCTSVQICHTGLHSSTSGRTLPAMQTLRSAPVPLLLLLCASTTFAAPAKPHTVTLGPAKKVPYTPPSSDTATPGDP